MPPMERRWYGFRDGGLAVWVTSDVDGCCIVITSVIQVWAVV